MTKTEFLTRLGAELKARKVSDMEDILGEYSRHFDYKLADGYSEEEIAARLGSPEELAAQFEPYAPAKSAKRARLDAAIFAMAKLRPAKAIFTACRQMAAESAIGMSTSTAKRLQSAIAWPLVKMSTTRTMWNGGRRMKSVPNAISAMTLASTRR